MTRASPEQFHEYMTRASPELIHGYMTRASPWEAIALEPKAAGGGPPGGKSNRRQREATAVEPKAAEASPILIARLGSQRASSKAYQTFNIAIFGTIFGMLDIPSRQSGTVCDQESDVQIKNNRCL